MDYPEVERAVTVKVAAELMGADESTIRKLVVAGELRGYRLGKRGVRIFVSSIQDYQKRQAIVSAPVRKAMASPSAMRRQRRKEYEEAMRQFRELGIIIKPVVR